MGLPWLPACEHSPCTADNAERAGGKYWEKFFKHCHRASSLILRSIDCNTTTSASAVAAAGGQNGLAFPLPLPSLTWDTRSPAVAPAGNFWDDARLFTLWHLSAVPSSSVSVCSVLAFHTSLGCTTEDHLERLRFTACTQSQLNLRNINFGYHINEKSQASSSPSVSV